MRIREVLVRWYKSFNYDYELKFAPGSKKKDWQVTEDGWLPHVRVNLEHDITAVVGANESGKSHLLDALHIVLSGDDHSRRDFCRYSTLFSVEKGKRLYPEVGAVFVLSASEQVQVASLDIPLYTNGDLFMLRPQAGIVEVLNENEERVRLNAAQVEDLQALLPRSYKLQTQVDLPDSVSLAALAGRTPVPYERKKRFELLTFLSGVSGLEALKEQVSPLFGILDAVGSSR